MRRRSFLKSTLASSAGVALAQLTGSESTEAEPANHRTKMPNILWICTDQQRYDTIHALGNEYIRTPNMDKLIKAGMAFTHAHCQSTICTPSRGSFLTGRYPRPIRSCRNGNDEWDNAAPLITKTLAEAGYDCGLAGKLHLSAAHGRIEKRPDDGYRAFHWSHHPSDSWPRGHAYEEWLNSQGTGHTELKKKYGYIPAKYHQTTWCTDRAIDFIKEKRNGPWLFSLNCFDPHPPLDPPKKYLDRFDIDSLPEPPFAASDIEQQKRLEGVFFQSKCKQYEEREGRALLAKYWAMIELIDENVGRLIETLERTGQRQNTLVILTSDHGNMVGHHGLTAKGCRFYEGLVRVPLIFSMPGVVKQNVHNDALVELVDIAPTLLELAGLPADDGMHGKSLLRQFTHPEAAGEHRPFVYSTYTNALAHGEKDGKSYGTMIRTKRYKLVNYHGHGRGELFDMKNDPGEFNNLWDDPGHRKVKMDLMVKSYDVTVTTTNVGTKITGRY
jgi:arylsulfatase A-like enzyme